MMPKSFNVTGNGSSDDQSYYYKSKKKDSDNRNHRSQSEPPTHVKNARAAQRGNDDCCDETNQSHMSCCADHTASGSKQRLWLEQQIAQQHQLKRQQQMQQMQQSQQNCYNTFQPNMNSTMIAQQQKKACQQKQQPCQQQQQPCQQQQHQCAARSPSAQYRSQAHSSRAECCPIQQQQPQKYPTTSPSAGNLQQYELCSSFGQNTTYKDCNQSQPKQSSCCQYRGMSPSTMQREVTFDQPSGSCCRTKAPKKANKITYSTLRADALPGNMSPEELYVQRANTLFMEMLVLDRSYPGVIQDTLDGKADFNDLSFQIAYSGKIPDKPFPVEPISLLEAIQMRIDYERDDIERNLRIRLEEEPECRNDKDKDKEKPRGMYYANEDKMTKSYGNRFHGGCNKCGYQATHEDIEKHFAMKHKSEVNDAVRAFLLAQNEYTREESAFSAHINTHESDFFGSPIKMKVYNGTTWPTD